MVLSGQFLWVVWVGISQRETRPKILHHPSFDTGEGGLKVYIVEFLKLIVSRDLGHNQSPSSKD